MTIETREITTEPVHGFVLDLLELRRRMAKPQRHRLLHGYPLAAAMPTVDPRYRGVVQARGQRYRFSCAADRGLLVGVLPHPFCNPSVRGCGFCTFPHQRYRRSRATIIVEWVIEEIDHRLAVQPSLFGRSISGLYFGGGTANLTPVEPFRKLCRKLNQAFDLSGAEVTLEGVPIYFLKQKPLLVDIMREELDARHFRISMGIQTFDEDRLRTMGRLGFGTFGTFRQAVALAHDRGMTVSGDLLFNLPWQSRQEMQEDLKAATEIGLDHLGLYHLVLFRGLGTEWSRDKGLLAGLPSNGDAAENWLALRDLLLQNDYSQTTLTNFEREELAGGPRRFIYEEYSFQAEQFDMLGFGPSAISFSAADDFHSAWKTLNPESASDYAASVGRSGYAFDRYFHYEQEDLRIFYLTRRLAALRIDRNGYRGVFGSDPANDFEREFAALESERLVTVDRFGIEPTPRGMFFADSIAALLAWRRLRARREGSNRRRSIEVHRVGRPRGARPNDNSFGHM
jgi:oxygen-independent coproporphyrinogen-3 oxidase